MRAGAAETGGRSERGHGSYRGELARCNELRRSV